MNKNLKKFLMMLIFVALGVFCCLYGVKNNITAENVFENYEDDAVETNIKVSVIVPVYNTSKYLDEALNSIQNQTLKEMEIICVNDGSKDNSLEILENHQKEDALNVNAEFSTPHFIRLLIDGGYIEPDNDLSVTGKPIFIKDTNLYSIANVINEKSKYQLPVVYVSKLSGGEYPVDIWRLAGRLKGVAHLLVQSEWDSNKQLRVFCKDKYEYNGAVGVYYPNASMKPQRFFYHQEEGFDEVLTRKIIRSVIQYCNAQQISELYTWQGVSNSLLKDRLDAKRAETLAAEEAQRKAEIEKGNVYRQYFKRRID